MNKENNSQPEKQSKALEIWNAKKDRLAEIEIQRTLTELGAIPNQDGDPRKWKVIGVGNIIEMGNNVWFNGNLHQSGWGSVALTRHAMDLQKDTQAMDWLAEKFPDALEGDWSVSNKKQIVQREEKAFTPPVRVDEGLPAVISYLTHERGIPKELVVREAQSGRIYATQKQDAKTSRLYGEYQCVFIGPSSAEIRSVLPDGFKGCCTGSDSERSGYHVMFQDPHEKTIVQTEAAVDALSYNAIYPNRFTISTNGAGRFDLQYKLTLEAFRNEFASIWAFDADTPGDLAAQRQFNAIFLREHLSEKLDISPEQVDKWILEQRIVNHPAHSPHELFLNNIDETEHKVFELHIDKETTPPTSEIIDTNKTSPSTITYKVTKKTGDLTRGEYEIKVTPQEIKDVLKKYKAIRHRPKSAKDWNEICKREATRVAKNYQNVLARQSLSISDDKDEQKSEKKSPSDISDDSKKSVPKSKPMPTTKSELKNTPATTSPVRQRKNRFARTPLASPDNKEEPSPDKMKFSSQARFSSRFKTR